MVVVEVFLMCNFFFVDVGESKLYCINWFFFIVVIWFSNFVNSDSKIGVSGFQCFDCYFDYYGFVDCVMLCQSFFMYVNYLCFGFIIIGDKVVFKSGGVFGDVGNGFCQLVVGIGFCCCYGCFVCF